MGRVLIENSSRINVYELLQDKRLTKETIFNPLASISVALTITSPSASKEITVPLHFARRKGTYGGVRLYLSCPRCHRAVTDIYLPHINTEFLCRHCHNLRYSCQVLHRKKWYELIGKHDYRQTTIQKKLKNKWLRNPTKTRLVSEFNKLNHIVYKGLNILLSKKCKR
jgi:hypothetical protein